MTGSARIVIIEDDAVVADMLGHLIASLGHAVAVARDGASALALLAARTETDLILLDRGLPDVDGLELLERIKADGRFARIPVIVATARDSEEDEAECFQRGCSDFVAKPFRPAVVLARVQTQLALRRALEALNARNVELEVTAERRTREVVRARDEAEFASARKSEQLAAVGAELRAPLREIIAALPQLEADPDRGTVAVVADRLRRGAEQLALVVEGLEAPGSGGGAALPQHAGCQTRALARELMDQLRIEADGAPVRATVEVGEAVPPVVSFDGEAVRRVLLIVVRNALRAIGDGRVLLRVGSEAAAGVLIFSIRATSTSAPALAMERLFLPLFDDGPVDAPHSELAWAGWAQAKRLVSELGASMAVVAAGPSGSALVLSVPADGL